MLPSRVRMASRVSLGDSNHAPPTLRPSQILHLVLCWTHAQIPIKSSLHNSLLRGCFRTWMLLQHTTDEEEALWKVIESSTNPVVCEEYRSAFIKGGSLLLYVPSHANAK